MSTFTHAVNPSLGFPTVSFCPHAPGFLSSARKGCTEEWTGPRQPRVSCCSRPHLLSPLFSLGSHTAIPTHPAREALSELTCFLPLQMCLSHTTPCVSTLLIGFLFLNLGLSAVILFTPNLHSPTPACQCPCRDPSLCWLNIWFTWLTSADKQTPPCTIYPLFLLCSLPVLPVHPLVGGIQRQTMTPNCQIQDCFKSISRPWSFLQNLLPLLSEALLHMIWLCPCTVLTLYLCSLLSLPPLSM